MRFLKSIPFLYLSVFVLPKLASACLDGAAISRNHDIAQNWGNVSIVLSVPILCLQIWRRGFTSTSIALIVAIGLLHLLNSGLHYSGMRGDCGYGEVSSAEHFAGFTGLLLVFQLFAATKYLLSKKRRA